MIATADETQLHELWTVLADVGIGMDTLTLDRTASFNLTLTVRVRSLPDVEQWAKVLDQPVHLAGSDGVCVGELAAMPVVVTSRSAT